MKSVLKNILLLSFIMVILGCEPIENNPDTRAYYKFSNADLKKIPSYYNNQNLIFTNNNDSSILIKVGKTNEINKNIYGEGWGMYSAYAVTFFHYDEKSILFHFPLTKNDFELYIKKWPVSLDSAKKKRTSIQPNYLDMQFFKFPKWNGKLKDFFYKNIHINEYEERTTLVINGIAYHDVIKISSNDTTLINENTIHTIYYAEEFGILGFDDLDGNLWRIQL